MGTVIGIDLGTTNSVAAFMGPGSPQLIPGPHGERLFPSLVAFSKGGEILVGDPAKTQIVLNRNTIYSVKRLMGKKFSEVKPYLHQFNYDIVDSGDDHTKIKINGDLYSPEEISAMILAKLKEAAEKDLKDSVNEAIITVPAYFNDSQRQATRDAGEIAGLKVLRIINEPTAASLAYSLKLKDNAKLLIYDFGGGTIDISVLEIANDVIKVLSTAGDIKIGGDDFDHLLANEFMNKLKDEYDFEIGENKLAVQRLRDEAEKAKKMLSQLDVYEVNLPFLAEKDGKPINFLMNVKRTDFESLISSTVEQTIDICEAAINASKLDKTDIDEVLLVGGTTRIPYVQDKLEEYFGKAPNKRVNPDEIVAMGAAIQGSIAKGETDEILLVDVIPISLGVKTHGEVFTKIVEANTAIPTTKKMVFSTAIDDQEEVEVDVFQGESKKVENNTMLGTFILGGIRPAPKGESRIEVSFEIDVNGILKVSAIDLSTGKNKEITIIHSGLLSKDEIEKLKKRDLIPDKKKEKGSGKKQAPEKKSKRKTTGKKKRVKPSPKPQDTRELVHPKKNAEEVQSLKKEINDIAVFITACRDNPSMTEMKGECNRLLKRIESELETDEIQSLKDLRFELENIKEDLRILAEMSEEESKKKPKKDKTNPFLVIPKDQLKKKK